MYHDVNGNGRLDAGEPPLAGATITLLQDGNVISEVTTAADGRYSLRSLVSDLMYQVRFTPPPGFGSTSLSEFFLLLGAGQTAHFDFFAQAQTPTPTATPTQSRTPTLTPSPAALSQQTYLPLLLKNR